MSMIFVFYCLKSFVTRGHNHNSNDDLFFYWVVNLVLASINYPLSVFFFSFTSLSFVLQVTVVSNFLT